MIYTGDMQTDAEAAAAARCHYRDVGDWQRAP